MCERERGKREGSGRERDGRMTRERGKGGRGERSSLSSVFILVYKLV